jgi:hypothetical protein
MCIHILPSFIQHFINKGSKKDLTLLQINPINSSDVHSGGGISKGKMSGDFIAGAKCSEGTKSKGKVSRG